MSASSGLTLNDKIVEIVTAKHEQEAKLGTYYSELMNQGNDALSAENYENAIERFKKASSTAADLEKKIAEHITALSDLEKSPGVTDEQKADLTSHAARWQGSVTFYQEQKEAADVAATAATATVTLAASAVASVTAPASTVTAPASTVTAPASTVTAPASTVTAPASTVTAPASTVTAPVSTAAAPTPPIAAQTKAIKDQESILLNVAGIALRMRAQNEKHKPPDDAYNPSVIFTEKAGLPETLGSSVINATEAFKTVKASVVLNDAANIQLKLDDCAQLLKESMRETLKKLGSGHSIKMHEWDAQFKSVKDVLLDMAKTPTTTTSDQNFLLARVDQIEKMQTEVLNSETKRMEIELTAQKYNNESQMRHTDAIKYSKPLTSWLNVKDTGEPRSNAVLSAVNPKSLVAGTYQMLQIDPKTKKEKKSKFYLHVDDEGNVQTSPSTYANFEDQIRAQAKFLKENNGAVVINWKSGVDVDWAMIKTMIRIATDEGLGIKLSKTVEDAMMNLKAEKGSKFSMGTSQQEINDLKDNANRIRAEKDRMLVDRGTVLVSRELTDANSKKTTEVIDAMTATIQKISQSTPLTDKLKALSDAQTLIANQVKDLAAAAPFDINNISLKSRSNAIAALSNNVSQSIDALPLPLPAGAPDPCAQVKVAQVNVTAAVEKVAAQVDRIIADRVELETYKKDFLVDNPNMSDMKPNELIEKFFPDIKDSTERDHLKDAFEKNDPEAYDAAISFIEKKMVDPTSDAESCKEVLTGLKSSVLYSTNLSEEKKNEYMEQLIEQSKALEDNLASKVKPV